MRRNGFPTTAEAQVGYAADERGRGIAYARVSAASGEHLLRVPFRVDREPTLGDREVGYAALTAIARTLVGRGIGRITFSLNDAKLVEELETHADVPDRLVLLYVRLRCTLNQFAGYRLERSAENDLAARARAEIALHVAA